MGKNVDDDMLMGIALGKLPSGYDHLRIVLDTIPDLEYDEFKERVRTFYQRRLVTAVEEDAALIAAFSGKCHLCHEYGHRRADCPRNNGGGHGHGQGGGRGGGRSGGKITCYHCNKTGHMKRDCWKLKSEQDEANVCMAIIETTTEPDEADMCLATKEAPVGDAWLMDSGSTGHMVGSVNGIYDFKSTLGKVNVANGARMTSIGVGKLDVTTTGHDGKELKVSLSNVLVVPGLSYKLLSVKRITASGGAVQFEPRGGGVIIFENKKRIPIQQVGQLYMVKLHARVSPEEQQAHVATDASLWHRRAGHRNYEDLKKLATMGVGVPEDLNLTDHEKCEVCEITKHKHASFPKTVNRQKREPLELVHTDVVGPMEELSIGGARYAIIFTDEATRWLAVYTMKVKSDSLRCLKQYKDDMSGLMRGRNIKMLCGLRSDNGGEYTGQDFKTWCKKNGIMQTFSGPHAPQQNGVAERSIRTSVEMARALLAEARLGKEMWAEALNTAVYIINRMPTATLDGDTPYHALFGKHASIDHLRVFGCRAYTHIYDGQRKKLDDKSKPGILVGYDEHNTSCYRVYHPSTRRVQRSVHVTFNEEKLPAKVSLPVAEDIPIEDMVLEEEEEQPTTEAADKGGEKVIGDKEPVGVPEPVLPEPVRAPRWNWTAEVEQRADRLGRGYRTKLANNNNLEPQHAYLSAESNVVDPMTMEEALQSPEGEFWKQAMDQEYEALIDNETWTLCEPPAGATAIASQWHYKSKMN